MKILLDIVGVSVKAGSHILRKYKYKKNAREPGRCMQEQKHTEKWKDSFFLCLHLRRNGSHAFLYLPRCASRYIAIDQM